MELARAICGTQEEPKSKTTMLMNRSIGRTMTLQILPPAAWKTSKHDLQHVFPNRLYLVVRKIPENWLTDSQILTLASDLVFIISSGYGYF